MTLQASELRTASQVLELLLYVEHLVAPHRLLRIQLLLTLVAALSALAIVLAVRSNSKPTRWEAGPQPQERCDRFWAVLFDNITTDNPQQPAVGAALDQIALATRIGLGTSTLKTAPEPPVGWTTHGNSRRLDLTTRFM